MSPANQSELNLINDFFPVCLMKCKGALNRMQPGDCMDVLVADKEIADALNEIIIHSEDTRVIRFKESKYYRLKFFKAGCDYLK